MKHDFLKGKKKWFFVFLYLSDLCMYAAAMLLAFLLLGLDILEPLNIRVSLFSFLILVLIYTNYDLYKNKRNLFDDTDFMKILYSGLITFSAMVIFFIMFYPSDFTLLEALAIALAISTALTSLGRFFLNRLIVIARKHGYDIKRTAFFGEEDKELLDKLRNGNLGYKVVKVTHDIKELEKSLNSLDIVFVKTDLANEKLLELMMKHDRVQWKIISSVLNLVIEPVAFDEFRDYPIINVSNKDATKGYKLAKRIIDFVLSGAALLILSPLFAIITVLIKIFMPGPVFFTQERLGQNLKPFKVYKFRSMVVGADSKKAQMKNEVKGLFKMKDDPRITRLGKFLRRSCLDELPQLINIFLGDMSIVGPRPHLRSELSNFKGWRMVRFKVKPGLTGLWQVNGRHELNFDKAVMYDIYYVKRMSLFLDIQIILKTIPAIIMTRGRY
jgi:exopolysaccharide biosynthesis polyprenyl glycosylphosphotransferase